jgi:ABC-type antimicrobial peptide transport system permease subunit
MGAGPADIVTLILRQSMTLIAAGTGIGLLLGVGAGRMLAVQRFGVPPPDARLLVASAALFTVVGLAASYAPVRRAVRVQAMDVLRYE